MWIVVLAMNLVLYDGRACRQLHVQALRAIGAFVYTLRQRSGDTGPGWTG